MAERDGLICAYRFDGEGGAQALEWSDLVPLPGEGFRWVHLHLEGERTRDWLVRGSGLSAVVADALVYEDVRPRCTPVGEGVLVNFRGVNLNPGANPEHMVAVRMYVDAHRAISVRRRRLMAVQDIQRRLDAGEGPRDAGDFLVALAGGLVERMRPVIADLEDSIDAMEDRMIAETSERLRAELRGLRRTAIALRRYIAPQREAMARLANERFDWIGLRAGQQLREIADHVTRYVEDLDSARERAAVVQDELSTRIAEQMNRNTYILSVIAAIFLPLGLITGVLGVNVAGMPGQEWEGSFLAVVLGLALVGVLGFLILRRIRWV